MRGSVLTLLFLTGCFMSHEAGDSGYLEVILIGADPRREILEVHVQTGGEDQTYIRQPDDDFSLGVPVALFSPLENGFHRLTLEVNGPRTVLYDTEVITRVEGPSILTVVMSPPCVDLSCPFGQVCRDGRCMEARVCETAGECPLLGDCGVSFCEEGRCIVRDDPNRCATGVCLDHICQ